MDAFDNFAACQRLTEFLDALSNWFVRLSRDRFWSGEPYARQGRRVLDALRVPLTLTKLIAPFTPFLAEAMWQNLAVAAFAGHPMSEQPPESVHLCEYPQSDAARIDVQLSERMALAREIVSLGRAARMNAKLKVRQPLSCVEVILADRTHQPWLEEHARLVADELNVKQVQFTQEAEQYITYNILPDLKRLGPRLGKRLPAVRKLLGEAGGGQLLAELESQGNITLPLPDGPVVLTSDDIQVRLQAKEGWAAAQGHAVVVVLSTELTPALIEEMLAREEIRVIQDKRKELGLDFTDRIRVGWKTQSQELISANTNTANTNYICTETLAVELIPDGLIDAPNASVFEVTIGGHPETLWIQKVEATSAPPETPQRQLPGGNPLR